MENKTVILGYSGHAYTVIDAAQSMGMKIEGYYDAKENFDNPFKINYLGKDENIDFNKHQNDLFFIAIGNNEVRKNRILFLLENNASLATVVHSKAIINSRVTIGEGSLVTAGAIINPMVRIGKGCIINTGAIIEHDCEIGDFTHIAPGAVLAGGVKVGENCFVGANSVVKENTTIQKNTIIGAGSVVIKDTLGNNIYIGNPAKMK